MTGTMSETEDQPLNKSWGRDCFVVLLTIRSGLRTPIAEIPTPDLAVPYAAPKHVNTMAAVQPIVPKNGCMTHLSVFCYQGVAVAKERTREVAKCVYLGEKASEGTDRVNGAAKRGKSANDLDIFTANTG